MKKKLTVLMIIILCFYTMNGCTTRKNESNINDEDINNEIEYEIVEEIDNIDVELNQYIDIIKFERGFTNLIDGEKGYNILVVTSGEKPSAGYGLDVKSVQEENGIVDLRVEEITPSEEADTAEVLTYPMVILNLPMEYTSFKVMNVNGEEFIYIPPNRINIEAQGVFIGQIDNNFIEVEVEDEPKSFMISEDTKEIVDTLRQDAMIDFMYYINENKQHVITEIFTEENDGDTILKAKGTYEGRIDNFSIEIMVDGEPRAFMNYEMDKILKDIKEGDEVAVEYTENEHGQLELKSIKKVE